MSNRGSERVKKFFVSFVEKGVKKFFVSFVEKGVKKFFAALRGQRRSCSCRSSRSFAALRGSKEVAVAVAVLRGPPRPFVDQKEVAVAVLRGPSRPFVEKRSCRCSCRSPYPFDDRTNSNIPNATKNGLFKISRSGRISYNYNQCLSLLNPRVREPHKKTEPPAPPLA